MRTALLAIGIVVGAGLLAAWALVDHRLELPAVGPGIERFCAESMQQRAADLSWVAPNRERVGGREIKTITIGQLPSHTGTIVRVAGVLHVEFEWVALYPSRAAMEEHPRGAPWVTLSSLWPDEPYWKTKGPSISDRCVVIEGMYTGGAGGHFGMFNGTIDVARLDVWSTPHRPLRTAPSPPPAPPEPPESLESGYGRGHLRATRSRGQPMTTSRISAAAIALSIAFGSGAGAGSVQGTAKDQTRSVAIPSSKRMADGKEWTTANLNVNTSSSYCYDDAESSCHRYGRLYTWEAAQRGCQSLGDRWRLPTDDEWRQLANHYGGLGNDSPEKGRAAYTALLSGGTSGFDAVLGGNRSLDGKYDRLEAHGIYWTASENDASTAPFYNFGKGSQALFRGPLGQKQMAVSVRCTRE